MNGHVVLCGLGKVAISTLEILHGLHVPVVIIAREVPSEWARRVERWAARVELDDDRDETALIEADLRSARALIIATDDDLANLETALDACELAPDVPVVVRLYDRQLAERVRRYLPVRAVLNAGDVAAGAFVAAVLGGDRLTSFAAQTSAVEVYEVAARAADEAAGRNAADIAEDLNAIPISVCAGSGTGPTLCDGPLRTGDRVLLARARLSSPPGGLPSLRGSKRRRRRRAWKREGKSVARMVADLWRQAPPILRTALIAFTSVVALGVVVFRFGLGLTWLNSLYFTASIVTTVGFGDISLLNASDAVKLFGTGLMLSGVALLVVGFGVVTDYLVSHRIEQALGRPGTTLRDHIIVAGLGNLGHRVALDLHDLDRSVLAVDQRSDLRFVSALGDDVPVLYGDASDERTLKQAGVEHARAVAAVTDNDIANLRIAELAKTMNGNVRTVVRLFSTRLVGRLGTTALGVDVALNPSVTAGATFAAAALASGVLQGLVHDGRLLMLRTGSPDLVRACVGRTVAEVRRDRTAMVMFRRPRRADRARVADPGERIAEDDELIVLDEFVAADGAAAPCSICMAPAAVT